MMMAVTATIVLELAFAPGVWTDISEDVRVTTPISWQRGMRGGGIHDRVAGTGTLTLALNNFPADDDTALGYYSPGHENQRAGFGLGIGCRLRVEYEELDRIMFVGTIESVVPEPGEYASRHVDIVVVDWMDEAATSQVEGIETLTNVRSDAVFEALVSTVPRQPIAIQTDVGMDTYPYAVDSARQEGNSVQSEFLKLAMSELGFVYVKADGTATFEGRRRRGADSPHNTHTFDAVIHGISVKRSRSDLINKVKAITHPRRVDDNPVVLYRLVQPIQLGSSQTSRLFGGYRDPEQRSSRTGGTDFIDPLEAGVDYIANTAADGSGADMTSFVSVDVSTTGNGVTFHVTNTGSTPIWVTTLQIRGRGIYDFETAVAEDFDDDSIAQFGRRTRTIDMPYQSDVTVGESAARFLVSLYKDEISAAESLSFLANYSDELMRQALLRDISDRIGIRESVTGLTDELPGTAGTRGWFVQGVRGEVVDGMLLRMTYTLSPADRNSYWLLGIVGSSELGLTTRLGYGIFQGHIDVAHADSHGDSAHSDVAHIDSHSDLAHSDIAHGDAGHGDVNHLDTHGDLSHQDTAHADTHSDTSHADVPHSDSHSDFHSDVSHQDTHSDVSHQDVSHVDSHTDVHFDDGPGEPHTDSHHDVHFDVDHGDVSHSDAHSDTSHADVPHSDSHGDSSHSDVAHVDTHNDVSHADVLHQDTHQDVAHSDGGHVDAGHQDVSHGDTHSDTNHADVIHADVHGDSEHGDHFG